VQRKRVIVCPPVGHPDHAISSELRGSVTPSPGAPTPWHAALRVADRAARAAATHLLASRSRLNLAFLMQRSPEQMARSIESEGHELISAEIRRAYPDHVIAGPRESRSTSLLDEGALWLIDALDGATAYQQGRPQYAVSVALAVNGQVRVAIVADPSTREVYRAIAGIGAWVDRPADPSSGAAARRDPLWVSVRARCNEAQAATVFPTPGSHRMPTYLGEIGRVMKAFKAVHRTSSSALALAQVAAGRLEAFWAHDQRMCDLAAGLLLVQQAGGEVRARDGLPVLQTRSIAAHTPTLGYDVNALLSGQ
jgi:myo-inositol-1(or 4)-monophosphatase